MTRYQLLLITILVAIVYCGAEPAHIRRQRFGQRQFARQEASPTPYPLAAELKPDGPALIYGPPQGNSAAPNDPDEQQQTPAISESFAPNPEAEDLDTEINSVEVNEVNAQPARLRNNRQRLDKLQVKPSRQRISARLEELPLEGEVDPAIVPAPAPAVATPVANPAVISPSLPVPQFYYVGAQQPYILAYSASAPQQLAW